MDFRNLRGVDRDGVAPGVGVSGGVAYLFFAFFEILKIPIGGSVGDYRRGHAVRQRIVDLAAGKTGGDLLGNIAESTIQLRSIIGIKSVLGTTRNTVS